MERHVPSMMTLRFGRLTCCECMAAAGADFCCNGCCPLCMQSCLISAWHMKRPSLPRC